MVTKKGAKIMGETNEEVTKTKKEKKVNLFPNTVQALDTLSKIFSMSEEELIKAYFTKLERDIIAQPEYWLWSHRRWKHKR